MTHTKQELINYIQRLATDTSPPTAAEFDADPDAPSSATVKRRFGSWNDGLAKAGFDPSTTPEYSDDDIIRHIHRLATGDTPPTLNELDTDPDAPASSTILERFGSWNDALNQANLTPRQPGRQLTYTDADILEHIRRLAADTSPPTTDEFNEDPDAPSLSTVRNRFDSWNDAVIQAGFTPNRAGSQPTYTTDEIIDHIRRLATDDTPPDTDKLDADPDAPSSTTVTSRFGSWNNALVKAGFDTNTQQYTDDELLNHIRRLATDDTPPTHAEFVADPDAPSSSTVYNRFGSWADAVRQANLTPRQIGGSQTYTDTGILDHIRRLATDDTPPTTAEFDADPDAPSSATVTNRFGSWSNAVSQADLTPRSGGQPTYTTDEVLEHIQRLATDGTPPTAAEFDADPDAPSTAVVTNKFGSWNDAVTEAGFDINNPQQYTANEMLEHIRRLATDNTPPTRDEFDADPDAPSSATVKRRFGSWNDALVEAGFDPRDQSANQQYTKAELREWVVSWTIEFGDPPERTEFQRAVPTPSPVTYESRFDGTFTEIRDRIVSERLSQHEHQTDDDNPEHT